MFAGLICTFLGHRIDRKRVEFDGFDLRARCDRCNGPMIRKERGWRRDRKAWPL